MYKLTWDQYVRCFICIWIHTCIEVSPRIMHGGIPACWLAVSRILDINRYTWTSAHSRTTRSSRANMCKYFVTFLSYCNVYHPESIQYTSLTATISYRRDSLLSSSPFMSISSCHPKHRLYLERTLFNDTFQCTDIVLELLERTKRSIVLN